MFASAPGAAGASHQFLAIELDRPRDVLVISPQRHFLVRGVATAAVAASVPEAVIVGPLDRHVARDWDDLNAEDSEEHGSIWVTREDLRGEGGGSITSFLFPEDF
jgi:hypothetical protein